MPGFGQAPNVTHLCSAGRGLDAETARVAAKGKLGHGREAKCGLRSVNNVVVAGGIAEQPGDAPPILPFTSMICGPDGVSLI